MTEGDLCKTYETLHFNLFSGPGAGKTLTAAEVFVLFKKQHVVSTLVGEFATDAINSEELAAFKSQPYIFGNQFHRMNRIDGKYQIAVNDSPLLLQFIYAADDPTLCQLAWEKHHSFRHVNIFLNRGDWPHSMIGRLHDQEQSIAVDNQILEFFEQRGIEYHTVGSCNAAQDIFKSGMNILSGK